MKRSKKTKHALVASVVSATLCCGLLLGTTFAWFTDSVTNTGNTIQAGTLDVGFQYRALTSAGDYDDVPETAAQVGELFTSKQWEPGRSQGVDLKVSNDGNLALKWELSFQNVNSVDGNEDNTSCDIADVLDVYVVAANATNLENAQCIGTLAEVRDGQKAVKTGTLEKGANPEEFSVILKMQEGADNRYQDCKVTFDVYLRAAQYTIEQDGFGRNQYDAEATYSPVKLNADNLEEKLNAAADGDTVEIPSGELDGDITIYGNKSLTIIGAEDGSTVINGAIKYGGDGVASQEDNTLTLQNLTIKTENKTAVQFAFDNQAENLVIKMENCTVEGNGSEQSFGVLSMDEPHDCKVVLKDVIFRDQFCAIAVADHHFNYSENPNTNNKVEMENVSFESCTYEYQLYFDEDQTNEMDDGNYYKDINDVIAKGDIARFNNVFTIAETKVVTAGGTAEENGLALQTAVEQAAEGATVLILPGDYELPQSTYSSPINGGLNYGINIDKSLSLVNAGTGDVNITGGGTGYTSGMILFTKYDVDVTIDGLNFEGGAWDIIGFDDPGVKNVTIKNCKFHVTGVNGTPVKLKLLSGEITNNTFVGEQCGYGVRIIGLDKRATSWPDGQVPQDLMVDIDITGNDFSQLSIADETRGVVQISTADSGTVTVSNNTFANKMTGETVKDDGSVATVVTR